MLDREVIYFLADVPALLRLTIYSDPPNHIEETLFLIDSAGSFLVNRMRFVISISYYPSGLIILPYPT